MARVRLLDRIVEIDLDVHANERSDEHDEHELSPVSDNVSQESSSATPISDLDGFTSDREIEYETEYVIDEDISTSHGEIESNTDVRLPEADNSTIENAIEYQLDPHGEIESDTNERDEANGSENAIENQPDPDSSSSSFDYESDDYDGDEFYEIDTDSEDDELPRYSLNNFEVTFYSDMQHVLQFDVDDEVNEWEYEEIDNGPSTGPFLSKSTCNVSDPHGHPEVFFNSLFEDRMWTILSDSTNAYARSKCRSPNGNRCTDPTHPDYRKHCRLNSWIDTTPGDIRVFVAHILIMGLVKKPDLEKYWNMNGQTRIPFFGKYMSRNRFQSILWNFHVNDDSHNPHRTHPRHDALCKIRPFVEMCERNFLYAYKPSKCLSFDEACCPFKGRLRFKVYNPMKPNRFHIKLYQVSESSTGYILAFHVYTGKNLACISTASQPLDPECTKTTRIVLGLLESSELLDKGHHVYMDNYYTSPELFSELYYRETYACGTVRTNRKGIPITVKNAKLKPLESIFLRKGPLLCLKWCGEKKKSKKKPVTIISTIHSATELLTKKKDPHGNRVPKPVPIYEYTKNMSGVDISDQYMAFHVSLRKSMKWSRKLFFHLLNMLILNSYLLNKKFGKKKMNKNDFIEHLANHLLETGSETVTLHPKKTFQNLQTSILPRICERHFPKRLSNKNGKTQALLCKACNFTSTQLSKMGYPPQRLPRKTTVYWCEECESPLCVTPCFELFHTYSDFRKKSLITRFPNM